jgi:hypothetical protein
MLVEMRKSREFRQDLIMTTEKKKSSELTKQEKMYCRFMLEFGDGEKAAIRAGVPMDDASTFHYRMEDRKDVKQYMDDLYEEMAKKLDLSEKDILRIWGDISLDNELRVGDRLKATELLARAKGMFKDSESNITNVMNIIGEEAYRDILAVGKKRVIVKGDNVGEDSEANTRNS